MKSIIENDKIIVFLNKKEIKNLNLLDEEIREEYFRNLFSKLRNIYNIDSNGYYNINIFRDINYGIILEIEKDNSDYYNYFNQIDINVNILKDSLFLYDISYEFIDEQIKNNSICYKKNDKIYLKIKDNIDDIVLAKILEYSNIVYGDIVSQIIKYGKKVII